MAREAKAAKAAKAEQEQASASETVISPADIKVDDQNTSVGSEQVPAETEALTVLTISPQAETAFEPSAEPAQDAQLNGFADLTDDELRALGANIQDDMKQALVDEMQRRQAARLAGGTLPPATAAGPSAR
jgi:hypothetical protein